MNMDDFYSLAAPWDGLKPGSLNVELQTLSFKNPKSFLTLTKLSNTPTATALANDNYNSIVARANSSAPPTVQLTKVEIGLIINNGHDTVSEKVANSPNFHPTLDPSGASGVLLFRYSDGYIGTVHP